MTSPLVTADWLRDNLADVIVFDAGYHLPTVDRDPVAEFEAAHIPGATHFDINAIADQSNPLPHMVPSADEFAAAMRALGVSSDSHVVFYDDSAIKPATRGWWMMRLFGHDRVSVLDGGLAAWRLVTCRCFVCDDDPCVVVVVAGGARGARRWLSFAQHELSPK